MIFNLCSDIKYLTFSNLFARPEIVHGIFTRIGGQSAGPYAQLNVGDQVGDRAEDVRLNRSRIAACMNGHEPLAVKQIHSPRVVVVDGGHLRSGTPWEPPAADAMITSVAGLPLMIQVADCQAVMLYDPIRSLVANVHSGWRGSISNIIGACIDEMKSRFHTDPADLIAGIGPSLGPCCAEFVHYTTEIPESCWPYKDDTDRFNFWALSHDQLTQAGVLPDNIEWSHICTKCNPHLFYSYRHDKTTGRFAAVIELR